MPFVDVSEYEKSMDEFLAHWALVDAALPSPLVIRGGYTRAALAADKLLMHTKLSAVTAAESDRQRSASQRTSQQDALRARLVQFRAALAGIVGDDALLAATPKVPSPTARPGYFQKAFDDMLGIWQRINTGGSVGFTGPLLLVGGYTLAQATADVASLNTCYTTLTTAERVLRLAIQDREKLARTVHGKLKAYRRAVVAAFGSTSPQAASLPALSEDTAPTAPTTNPGATP